MAFHLVFYFWKKKKKDMKASGVSGSVYKIVNKADEAGLL